ncbi:T9SS type A sorting domain-containing protein [Fulvivirgaceae bacterium BMA12]|uniref:T9SS type A sorting domain-containing protein n=1 Tax=Agaribacillus aureus TaxID=3051825 RepID=A0ABT8LB82_9BACT|nr:T9SS type A sorting domain-containing protein [Fulvivirgaceae bacterium BMA12]
MRKFKILLAFLLSIFFSFKISAQTPGNIGGTNLRIWLKAGTGTNTIVDGENISSWIDQSAQGNNASQNVVSEQPQYVLDAINSNAALLFDGTEDFMDITTNSFPFGANSRTLYLVLNYDSLTNPTFFQMAFSYGNPAANQANGFGLNGNGDLLYFGFGNDERINSFGDPDNSRIYIGTYDGTIASIFVDGLLSTSTARSWNTVQNLAYIGQQVLQREHYSGEIAEILLYDKVLTEAERFKVDSYLAVKYGITLAHDYFNTLYDGTNSASTRIYDISNGFGNDIAGIGREDSEELNQVTSKSENDDAIITVTGPTSLDDGDYLLWGNNDLTGTTASDLPIGYDERLERIWFFDEKGDVGAVTMRFDLSQIGDRSDNPDDYAILISNNTNFSSATVVTNGASISNNELTFTNVNIADGDHLTLAVSAVRGPGAISSGMGLWLRGDRTTLDGTTLNVWPDQSGNGNNLVPVPFDRPVLEMVMNVNANPYLKFTNDNGGTTTLSSNSNQSAFIAVLRNATNGVDVFEQDNDVNPRLEIEGGVYRGNGNAGFVSTSNTGNWNILGFLNNSLTDHRIYVDGSLEDTDINAIAIGASLDYNLFMDYTGDVAEVIYYENTLSDVERRQLETYLAIKYGITLDISSQDYLNGAGATILNRTAFTGYNSIITGIGQASANSGENAQGLNQTQSKNVNISAIVTVSKASNLDDGEYLIWGSDNATAIGSLSESSPSPAITDVTMMLNRKWKVTETGEVGTVTLSFDLEGTSVSGRALAQYTLVIDDNEDISSPLSIVKPTSLNGNVVSFEDINLNEGYYFVLGTNVSAAPGDIITGLSLWLNAGRGTNTTVDGENVNSWTDGSGNGFNATAVNAPNYESAFVNSNPTLRFNINEGMTGNDIGIAGDVTYAVYLVLRNAGNTATGFPDVFRASGNGRIEARNLNAYGLAGSGGASTPTYADLNSWHIVSILADGTNVSGHGDGVFGTGNTSPNVFTAGGYTIARDNGTDIYLSEMIVFTEDHSTDGSQEIIETYLAIKYGITLGHNYYNTLYDGTNAASTTIYDISTFPNNIAGIGREDSELLYQTQSKSENSDAILMIGSASDLDDGEYLIWGNDNGALTETVSGVPSGVNDRLTRKWKVEQTGNVGTVTVTFDVSSVIGVGTAATDFALIVDTDADFTSGATLINADDFTANIVTFNGVSLPDGTIFSLATGVNPALTEISNTLGNYEISSSCPALSGSSFVTLRDASGRIVMRINPNGNDLGPTCWGVNIRTSGNNTVIVEGEDYYLDRNFYITPTNQPGTSVTVQFYILNDEISDIRAHLATDGKSNGTDVNEYLRDFFRITKRDGSGLTVGGESLNAQLITPTISNFGATGYIAQVEVSNFSEFLPGTNSNDPGMTLPVSLVYFKAMPEKDKILLEWKTVSEQSNDFFAVERGTDGQHFEEITRVQGSGNSSQPRMYNTIDKQPVTGTSYYRLKQTDFDGEFAYSQIIRVKYLPKGFRWRYYPNPVSDLIYLQFNTKLLPISFSIQATDLAGKVRNIPFTREGNQIQIDISLLPQGIHILKIFDGDVIGRIKIIKK